MDTDNTLKVKTVEEMNFEQYQEIEAEDLTVTQKKFLAFRKSLFSRCDSSVFDSEDERPSDKENKGAFLNNCFENSGSGRKLR